VSEVLKEVSMEASDDAGDWDERNFERNRRRYLRGMGLGIEGHEKRILAFVKVGDEFDE
jgi:hypothetical protein